MGGDDDHDCAGNDVGHRHLGVLLVEKGVDKPAQHPGDERLRPDESDGAVELGVLDGVVGLVGLFEAIRDRGKEYIF